MDVAITAGQIKQGSTCSTIVDGIARQATVERIEVHRDAIEERFKPGPTKLILTLVFEGAQFTQPFFQASDGTPEGTSHIPAVGDKHETKPGYVVDSVTEGQGMGVVSVLYVQRVSSTAETSKGAKLEAATHKMLLWRGHTRREDPTEMCFWKAFDKFVEAYEGVHGECELYT